MIVPKSLKPGYLMVEEVSEGFVVKPFFKVTGYDDSVGEYAIGDLVGIVRSAVPVADLGDKIYVYKEEDVYGKF